ncbi:hypothetical protein NONO_c09690 [Nocardia nova SH22a]|uniref:Uncharacterized protein n=1 Tax=Nocardia nova SH22a TaxID=1415166 RepID=W5TEV4_9NOCA|nr:hypothetical protein [Nocardia nova]AHH15776.1 hypothetical protein NONO_c09690 [Nocardia nova SH22a]
MNWADTMAKIADEHADNVRRIRYRIEEVDDEARAANAALGVVASDEENGGDTAKEPPRQR